MRSSGLALLLAMVLLVLASPLAARPVVERSERIGTPDGLSEAVLFHPAGKGRWPAVLLWPDFSGPHGFSRDVGRSLAKKGYVVVVPDAFYRSRKPGELRVNAGDAEAQALAQRYRAEATDAGIERDAAVYIQFLDSLAQTDRGRKAATFGYGLGGAYAFRTAAVRPDRIAAVGSIYGVSVAAARPTSPHLLVPKTHATYYVAIARDHDYREPGDKADLKAIIAAAQLPGTVEVYPADRGWADPASRAFDPAASKRALGALVRLLERSLR